MRTTSRTDCMELESRVGALSVLLLALVLVVVGCSDSTDSQSSPDTGAEDRDGEGDAVTRDLTDRAGDGPSQVDGPQDGDSHGDTGARPELPQELCVDSDDSPRVVRGAEGTNKVCQLIGDEDRERGEPTSNQTFSDVGIFGTDLGVSFEHDDKLWFLFGDTVEEPSAIRYFTGTDDDCAPIWSPDEVEATPLFDEPCVGELSVQWNEPLRKWLMTYNCDDPRGIRFRTADHPWGPWSDCRTCSTRGRMAATVSSSTPATLTSNATMFTPPPGRTSGAASTVPTSSPRTQSRPTRARSSTSP